MKISYFGYYLKHIETGQKTLCDLSGVLKAFSQLNNRSFKNSFVHNDENLFLIHSVGDFFLFLTTRSNEIIKKVNTSSITLDEITDLLSQDEQLGFASYVLFKSNHFSFGSTLLAPKFDVFAEFVDSLLTKIGITDWEFSVEPLMYEATKAELLAMRHIGRATIQLRKQNTVVSDLLNTFNVDIDDATELDEIEIIIKPKLRKNIKVVMDKVIQNIPEEGIEKMMIKAKNDSGSQLMDYYLASKGMISDYIDKTREERIPELFESKSEQNQHFLEKLAEYLSDENFEKIEIPAIADFDSVESWDRVL